MANLSVYIGRFSPFHNGHVEVLSRAFLRSDSVLILIGSSYQNRNIKNPFTYEERSTVISSWIDSNFPNSLYRIVPLRDVPYNDQKWIANVQLEVETAKLQLNIFSKPKLLGANKDESTWYLNSFGDFFELDMVKPLTINSYEINASNIRAQYFTNGIIPFNSIVPIETVNFLNKFAKDNKVLYDALSAEYAFITKYRESWKAAPYPPIFVTVDAVVVQSGHVLVVERDAQPGKGLWALPGGFLEQNERIVDGCIRELIEETKIELSRAQLLGSIAAKEVFDHPDRSLRGRTITHAFLFKLRDELKLPKVKPQVGEVKKVMWVPLAKALDRSENWFEDHHSILSTMIS